MTGLAQELRAARLEAGMPSTRALSREIPVSHAHIAATFAGTEVPSLRVALLIARAIGADGDRITALWTDAQASKYPETHWLPAVTLREVLEAVRENGRKLDALLTAAGITLPPEDEP